MKIVLMLNMEL